MENRELFSEINALVASIAKAHGIDDKQASSELESGALVLSMERDENSEPYISAVRQGAEARIYQGVILYAPGVTPPTSPEDAPEDGEHCGSGESCGCAGSSS